MKVPLNLSKEEVWSVQNVVVLPSWALTWDFCFLLLNAYHSAHHWSTRCHILIFLILTLQSLYKDTQSISSITYSMSLERFSLKEYTQDSKSRLTQPLLMSTWVCAVRSLDAEPPRIEAKTLDLQKLPSCVCLGHLKLGFELSYWSLVLYLAQLANRASLSQEICLQSQHYWKSAVKFLIFMDET